MDLLHIDVNEMNLLLQCLIFTLHIKLTVRRWERTMGVQHMRVTTKPKKSINFNDRLSFDQTAGQLKKMQSFMRPQTLLLYNHVLVIPYVMLSSNSHTEFSRTLIKE